MDIDIFEKIFNKIQRCSGCKGVMSNKLMGGHFRVSGWATRQFGLVGVGIHYLQLQFETQLLSTTDG
jgi:hypothetical protein